jgi:hypothetical protein
MVVADVYMVPAIAWRHDRVESCEQEVKSDLRLTQGPVQVVTCPKGCDVTYDLFVEKNAPPQTINEYVRVIKERMGRGCPKVNQGKNHTERIYF